MKKYKVHKILGLVMMASSALAVSQTAGATVTNATSTGYGLGADLGLLGSPVVSLTLPTGATGMAPIGYDNPAAVLAADLGPGVTVGALGLNLGAGANAQVIHANAFSNVDGSTGSKVTSASSSIDDLDVSLDVELFSLPIATLVGLNNVTLTSSAAVTGDYGTMSTLGAANIVSADLNLAAILGIGAPFSLDLSVFAEAAPNTEVLPPLLNNLGISLIVNEQLINGSANGVCLADSCSLEVNALHLMLDAVNVDTSLLGVSLPLASLDLKLGHSYAEMSAVPVPAAVWLFGSGILGLVGFGRRRQA